MSKVFFEVPSGAGEEHIYHEVGLANKCVKDVAKDDDTTKCKTKCIVVALCLQTVVILALVGISAYLYLLQIPRTDDRLAKAESELSGLKSSLASAEANNTNIKDRLAKVESELLGLKSALASAEANITYIKENRRNVFYGSVYQDSYDPWFEDYDDDVQMVLE